ncbi:MAG: PqqD family protein [Firmicutes bacterium]|nr:PqqD family protein [Bacillota bacterium]
MLKQVPVKNPDVVWRDLEGEGVLLNPVDGKYFGLNAVGLSVWDRMDGKCTLEKIVTLLLEEYEVERPVLEKDIVELASQMAAGGLITFID